MAGAPPFFYPDPPAPPWRIKGAPPDRSVALNPNLFKNNFPIISQDRLPVRPVRLTQPAPQTGLNPNLFKNNYPFAQYDWAKPVRLKAQPDPQAGLNPNLFKNPYPFGVTDVPRAGILPDFVTPSLPYNQALYSVTVQLAPFNQTDWARPTRLRAALPVPETLNPNLFTNPYPFNQSDWAKPQHSPLALPQPPASLNPNLFANPYPFNPTDVAPAFRARPAVEIAAPLNLNLFGTFTIALPFNQYDFPPAKRAARPAFETSQFNINLAAALSPMPFNTYDFTPAKRTPPRINMDTPNQTILISVAPGVAAEPHTGPFFVNVGRLMGL